MVEAHKITLNIEFDSKSWFGIVLGSLTNVTSKAFLAVECAFALATRIGIRNEATIPPLGTAIIEKVVNDAVAKGCSNDFANDWIVDDKGDAAARFIKTAYDAVAEVDDIFHSIELETVFVDSMFFAFSGGFVGVPEFV